MKELNNSELKLVSGGVPAAVAIVVIPVASKVAYEAGKKVGQFIKSLF